MTTISKSTGAGKGSRNRWRFPGRPAILAALFSLTSIGSAAPRADRTVDYRLGPVVENGRIVALAVMARFTGDPSGVTRFGWVGSWAGEHRLGQWARGLTVSGARSVVTDPSGRWVIRAAPGAPVTVRYRIVSAFVGEPSVDDSRQPMPVVQPDWFYAVGEALFARPGAGDDDRPARFVWVGPRRIGFASDLEHGGGRTTLGGITESIVIGGRDLHVVSSGPPGRQVRVARVGRYAFDGAVLDALALKVIDAERGFWGERNGAPFLVTMAPIASRPNHMSYSGTGRDDGFALWMDTAAPVDRLAWLLGHEYFHHWNSVRLGAMPSPPKERGYWFSEGLTDFYATRLMLRAGLISPDQFAATWNERLRRYAGSRYRTAPNEAVAAKFWGDEQAEAMQYQRGALLAVLWDGRLRRAGVAGGLDGVLRAQAARLPTLPERPQATDLFADTARTAGLDVGPDIAAHVDRGVPVMLPADAFGRCARVTTDERPVFARGWDVAATEAGGNVVAGLDPTSPAHAAGLRDGMRLLARLAGTPDDSRVDYVMRVGDGAAERVIRFRPAGTERVVTQELVLDRAAFAATPDACRAALAG